MNINCSTVIVITYCGSVGTVISEGVFRSIVLSPPHPTVYVNNTIVYVYNTIALYGLYHATALYTPTTTARHACHTTTAPHPTPQ